MTSEFTNQVIAKLHLFLNELSLAIVAVEWKALNSIHEQGHLKSDNKLIVGFCFCLPWKLNLDYLQFLALSLDSSMNGSS